jgi:hypothetical protein
MSSQHPHGELVNENVHHEESDIDVRAIITFIVVLTVIAVGIQIAMVGLFKVLNVVENKSQPVVSPLASGPAQVTDFPSPSLQTTPWTDLQKLRAGETQYLHSYGWIDQPAGIARIPIDRAKTLLLQKGLPVRPDAVTDPREGTRFAATGESSGGRNLTAGQADNSSPVVPAPSAGAAPEPAPAGGGGAAAKKPGGGL